jgi:hypothetical protein
MSKINKHKITNTVVFSIFAFMAITLMIPQGKPAPAQAGEINSNPGFELIQEGKTKQEEAQELEEKGQKLEKAGELLIEACKLTADNPEDCGSNNYDNLNQELEQLPATPDDNISKKETGSVVHPTQATTLSDNWKPFLDFATANPWRGATFPEGNHLEIAKANMARYEDIDGCHPYLMAAIHYSETGLQMSNGANGQGVFQHYSSPIRYPANSTATDFKEQAQRACNHIKNKVGGADLSSLDDVNLIGKALALYNGCYSPGIRAYARGDYGTPTGWDKCPYTANYLTNNEGMKQCAVDGCRSHNTRAIYGTMAFIAHLQIN